MRSTRWSVAATNGQMITEGPGNPTDHSEITHPVVNRNWDATESRPARSESYERPFAGAKRRPNDTA